MKKETYILNGTKVRLRPITMDDTNLIVDWRANESVRKNFIYREPVTVITHQNWMRTKVASGEVIQFIIERMPDNEPIGSTYFRDVDLENRSAEFGIFIGVDSARGSGLGTESIRLMVSYGLNELKLRQITLRLLKKNKVAYHCYSKIGFRVEKVCHDVALPGGTREDIVFMKITEDSNIFAKIITEAMLL